MSFVTRRALSTLIPPKVRYFFGVGMQRGVCGLVLIELCRLLLPRYVCESVVFSIRDTLKWIGRRWETRFSRLAGGRWGMNRATERLDDDMAGRSGNERERNGQLGDFWLTFAMSRPLVRHLMLSACSVLSTSTRSFPVDLLLRSRPRASSLSTRPSTLARTPLESVCLSVREGLSRV